MSMAETPGEPSVPETGAQSSTLESVKAAAHSVADLAGEATTMGLAWLELARAEAIAARNSALRIAGAVVAIAVLALVAWLFLCAALGFGLAALFGRNDVAMAVVAGLNLALIGVLAVAIRRWWRRLQMPDSRAALADIARALVPGEQQ